MKFAIVCLFNNDGIYLSQKSNPRKTMYLLYQTSGGKYEEEKTSRQKAIQKVYKETKVEAKSYLSHMIQNSTAISMHIES